MDVVFQKTRELGQALMESEAYLKMKAAEDKAMQNEEAARAMGEYLEKRQELQSMMQSENPDPGELKRISDEMDETQERLQMMDNIVELTDKIVALKDGRVAEQGSPAELYAREDGIFRRMTDLQAQNAAWSV